jgi:uncharacterized protein
LDEDCRRHQRLCQRGSQAQLSTLSRRSLVDEHGGLLKSAATEREILSVLSRPQIAAVTIPTFCDDLAKLLARAELVAITERITACRDPHDDKFLELAVNGRADLIISGDADLLALNPFRDIPILTPAAFMQRTAR